MSSKTAVTLLIIMALVSGVFIVYLFFSAEDVDNNTGMVETRKVLAPKVEPNVQAFVSESQKKVEILNKLEEFRKNVIASSSETNSSASDKAIPGTDTVTSEKSVTPMVNEVAQKQAKILSDLEKFRNSVKK